MFPKMVILTKTSTQEKHQGANKHESRFHKTQSWIKKSNEKSQKPKLKSRNLTLESRNPPRNHKTQNLNQEI